MTKTKGVYEWAVESVNFCLGCKNDCLYCYAKNMLDRNKLKSRDDWINMVIKPVTADRKFRLRSGWIMSPSSHDLFEDNVDLAIAVFKNILEPGNMLLIVTKPRLSVIKKICKALMAYRHQILFRFTITTGNDSTREYWEPNSSTIRERVDALSYAYTLGYQTSVSIEPYLDVHVKSLVLMLNRFVTDTFWVGPMNLDHLPKKYWNKHVLDLYSPATVKKIKKELDELMNEKIKYKDHFLTKLEE